MLTPPSPPLQLFTTTRLPLLEESVHIYSTYDEKLQSLAWLLL